MDSRNGDNSIGDSVGCTIVQCTEPWSSCYLHELFAISKYNWFTKYTSVLLDYVQSQTFFWALLNSSNKLYSTNKYVISRIATKKTLFLDLEDLEVERDWVDRSWK